MYELLSIQHFAFAVLAVAALGGVLAVIGSTVFNREFFCLGYSKSKWAYNLVRMHVVARWGVIAFCAICAFSAPPVVGAAIAAIGMWLYRARRSWMYQLPEPFKPLVYRHVVTNIFSALAVMFVISSAPAVSGLVPQFSVIVAIAVVGLLFVRYKEHEYDMELLCS